MLVNSFALSMYSVPPILGAIFALGLAIFILAHKPRSQTKLAFAGLCISIIFWLAPYAIAYSTKDQLLATNCARVACTSVALFSLFLYQFVVSFLALKSEYFLLRLSYVVTFLLLLGFLFTNLFLSGTYQYFWGYYSKAGPLHPIYLAASYSMWLRGFYLLYKQLGKEEVPLKRAQIKYSLLAFLVAVPATIDYIPKYGVEFYPIGFTFALLFVLMTAYAIVRHQLMDIEVLVKRTVVFAGLVTAVVGVVSLVAFVSQDVLAHYVAVPKWISNILSAAIIAGLYGRLRDWLVNATDTYLFQKKYDVRQLLKKFTDEVMVQLNLDQLVKMTVETLTQLMKLDSCSLLLINKDSRKFQLVAAKGIEAGKLELDEVEPFMTFLRETHEPIGLDGELGKIKFPEAVTNRLKELKARLCLPMEIHEELVGVLCLGKKKSDEEFTKEDLDVLSPVAKTLAIAVSNAQLVEELQKTQAEAAQKEKLAVIGTLSAGINHEICNPLGIVKAQCEAFLLDQQDGILVGKTSQDLMDRMSSILQVALKQIDRATAITQKLSNFAKPIKEPTAQPVSIPQEIDEVLLLVGHDLKLDKIEVVKEIDPNLPSILVDRRQLQEVLFNILRNAGQAIKPPGTITVRAHTHQNDVRVIISDTGSGMPPETLNKIYNPFFTTKEPGKGTGLGLFIVRQIVERNKGRITVESTVGKGTTFYLDFPAPQLAGAVA